MVLSSVIQLVLIDLITKKQNNTPPGIADDNMYLNGKGFKGYDTSQVISRVSPIRCPIK